MTNQPGLPDCVTNSNEMAIVKRKLSKTFKEFFDSEKSSGMLLIVCTFVSLIITNSFIGAKYLSLWQTHVGGLSIEHWINDALMAIFFLLIGLELERELYVGELSDLKNALLPIFAALGGICLPALIHFSLNNGLPAQAGIGIPMATDIAFALGVLALLGSRVPASLKVFLTVLKDLRPLAQELSTPTQTSNLIDLQTRQKYVGAFLATPLRYFAFRTRSDAGS